MRAVYVLLALLAGLFLIVPAQAGDCCSVDCHCSPALVRDCPGYQLHAGFDTTGVENCADWREEEWSEWIACQMGLDPIVACEVRTFAEKRIDILTAVESIEVERISKWYESIGQAGHGASASGKQPAVLLLFEGTLRDEREIALCSAVCERFGVNLYVQKIPPKPAGTPKPEEFGLQFEKPVPRGKQETPEADRQPSSTLWRQSRGFVREAQLQRFDHLPVGHASLL